MKTTITTYTLPFDRDLHICLLSDLHQRNPHEAIALVQQLQPDVICVAGDTFERYGEKDYSLYRGPLNRWLLSLSQLLNHITGLSKMDFPSANGYLFLKELTQIAPVYLSLGNHEKEMRAEDVAFFKAHHIHFLDNCAEDYEGITIGGLSCLVDEDFLAAFKNLPEPKILLCHHPEYYDIYHLETMPLILSGHTHGGQMIFFGKGLFASGQGLWPKYVKGIYHDRMIVSGGLANTVGLPRWHNPCEVVSIYLTNTQ